MGKRGPRPTPTAQLRLVGSRELEKRGDEPQPQLGTSRMPTGLPKEATAEWRRVVPELTKIGVLALIDRAVLIGYCEAWSLYRDAIHALRKTGATYTTSAGNVAKHPNVSILNENRLAFLRFAGELGLSPSARVRLTSRASAPSDPLGQFVGSKA